MPTISVIVPVYKVEKYLCRCVDSILNQSFADFELILVDDGSPDNCPEICDCYKEKESRIKVIHKENGGLASARVAGIKVAKGKYISFCDSDDYLENDFLEILYKNMVNSNCHCISSEYRIVSDIVVKNPKTLNVSGIYDVTSFKTKCFHMMDLLQNIHGWEVWSKLFVREIIFNNDIVDDYLDICSKTGSYAEDLTFYFLYLLYCNKIGYIDYQGYNYFQRKDSIIQSNVNENKINEINEVSYGLFRHLKYRNFKKMLSYFPMVHIWIINNSLSKIEDINDIAEFNRKIKEFKWYRKYIIKALKMFSESSNRYGRNKTFNLYNKLFFSIHNSYRLFSLLDCLFYKFFKM